MANIGQIDVGMSLDAQDFGRELDFVKTEVRTFAGDLDRVGNLAKGFLGGFAAMRTGGFLVDIARDAAAVEEAVGSLGVIFGEQAGAVEEFSRGMARQYNVAVGTMLDASGRLGSMFEGAGLGASAVAEYSKNIGRLAVDYSRFKNATVGTSLDKMISGLSGEAEPLRQFGIFLSEPAVKAKALELGLGKLHGELTEGEKIQARYALIMEKGAIAMGSADREAAGAAARIEGLAGAWENFKVSLGDVAAPPVAAIFGEMTEALKLTGALWEDNRTMVGEWGADVGGAIEGAAGGMGVLAKSVGFVGDELAAVRLEFKATQRDLVGLAGSFAGTLAPYLGGDNAPGVESPFGFVGDFLREYANEAGAITEVMDDQRQRDLAALSPSEKIKAAWDEMKAGLAATRGELAKPLEVALTVKPPAGLPDFKEALKIKPLLEPIALGDLVKADKRSTDLGGFAGAAMFGSRDWASTILRNRFGGSGRDPVADNTRRTAEGVDKLIGGVSVMTGKLEALKSEPAPDWR